MTFYNKAKWVLGILMVFVLVITTNLIDRSNFLKVKDSVLAIYEDRLVAYDLIFEMSKSFQEKEVATAISDSFFFSERNNQVNIDIQESVLRFERTKLTVEEENLFNDFKNNLDSLNRSETSYIQSKFVQKAPLFNQISKVKENLYDLSKIQLNEGGRQMTISKRAIDTVELFTQLEIYVLIFLAILIQIIVIYKPKEK